MWCVGMSLTERSYAFEAVIHPIPDTVVCDEIRPSRHGELIGVDKAECRPPVGL